jgi:hypothetical protein
VPASFTLACARCLGSRSLVLRALVSRSPALAGLVSRSPALAGLASRSPARPTRFSTHRSGINRIRQDDA